MELAAYQSNLPANIEDLSKFVLIGREKMTAVRAEIRAIDKLGLAEEVRRQKLDEAQMISEAVLDAEVKIGSLTAQMPKASGGDRRSSNFKSDNGVKFEKHIDNNVVKLDIPKPKIESIRDLGFTSKQVERFEKLAQYPEIVEQAKAEARERDDIVSRSFVLQKIDEAKKPHIAQNSGNNEWYTPQEYTDAARSVMGGIDLDPASCDIANEVVKADTYYTAEMDGLKRLWNGRVWLNPPYAGELIPQFIDKLKTHVENGDIEQAIVLVNNATETAWFNSLISISAAVVFPKSRVKFYMPDGKTGAPLQGQAVIYIGQNPKVFMEVFSPFGWGAFLCGE